MKRLIFWITIFFVVFYFYSCQKNTNQSFIPPNANISNITDSSAQVDVQVTKQSNAHSDNFLSIMVDSVSLNGNKFQVNSLNFFVIGYSKLDSSYSAKISNLKSKTKYYLKLEFADTDATGLALSVNGQVGSTKSFTTN